MMVLEFWAFYSLFYFIHEEGGIESLSMANLEEVFTLLVRSIYYVSLILVKARKSGILPINGASLEKFNFLVKKFNFPTGVPLIKTIKEGNGLIREKIRKVLFYTSRRVRRQFEWTLENVDLEFEQIIEQICVEVSSELKRKSRKVFIQMNTAEFFSQTESGKNSLLLKKQTKTNNIFDNSNLENSSGIVLKSKIEFHEKLSEKYTASEFLLKALSEEVNSNSFIREARQRRAKNSQKKKPKTAKKNGKGSKVQKSKRKRNQNSMTTSRTSQARGQHNSQTRRTESGRREKVASTRPERRREHHSKVLYESKFGVKSSSVSTKRKKQAESKQKEKEKSNFKMASLLSGLSAKYQPLSNVSELRDSALSIKRENEKKNLKWI